MLELGDGRFGIAVERCGDGGIGELEGGQPRATLYTMSGRRLREQIAGRSMGTLEQPHEPEVPDRIALRLGVVGYTGQFQRFRERGFRGLDVVLGERQVARRPLPDRS